MKEIETTLTKEELLETIATYKKRIEETEALLARERFRSETILRVYNTVDILCRDYCNSETMSKETFETCFFNIRMKNGF